MQTTNALFAIVSVTFGLALATPAAASAQGVDPNTRVVSAHDNLPGTVGVGLGVGAPTGLTLELRSGFRHSFEAAIGLDLFDERGGYAHLVYKLGLARLHEGPTVSIPIYLGIGGFIYDRDRRGDRDDVNLGLRVPFGVNFNFRTAPLQLFVELALLATVVDVGDDDDGWAGVGGYVGFRWWL